MIRKETTINIYSNYKVILLYCDYKDVCKFFKNKVKDEIKETGGLTCTFPNLFKSYIWINTKASHKQSTLVHEACHVSLDICKILNIKEIEYNQEPFAYLVDYIFEKFYKHIV